MQVSLYVDSFVITRERYQWLKVNGRRIYPFNKGLRIYGGGYHPPFDTLKMYFCLWYELETLQIVRLAFLV